MILTLIAITVILVALYLAKATFIPIFIIWYISASLITFFAFYFDKKSSIKNPKNRISENNLHTLELVGGWPGALIASRMFRHKTSKLSYQIVLWSIILIHILFWIWLKWNTLQHFIPLPKLKTLIN